MADVFKVDLSNDGLDGFEVPNVEVDDGKDVDPLDGNVENDVGHRQAESERPFYLHQVRVRTLHFQLNI